MNVGARYLGGHPSTDAGRGKDGRIHLGDHAIEWSGGWGTKISIPYRNVIACELRPLQQTPGYTFLEAPADTVQRLNLTPVAHITCLVRGLPHEVRFHVTEGAPGLGRLSAAGVARQSQNAWRFRDELYKRQREFARPSRDLSIPREAEPTKRCPDCAEEILVAARICRFCRYEFSEREIAEASRQYERESGAAERERTLADFGDELEDWLYEGRDVDEARRKADRHGRELALLKGLVPLETNIDTTEQGVELTVTYGPLDAKNALDELGS